MFGERPKTTPAAGGGRKRTPGSVLENMLESDNRDWLDMASGSGKAEESRPKSAGGVLERGSKAADKKEQKPPGTDYCYDYYFVIILQCC